MEADWWDYGITFVLYCLVGITDYFDGYVARAQGTVSRLGVFLDPIADKIMVAAVIVMLVSTRKRAGCRSSTASTSSRRSSSCCARSPSRPARFLAGLHLPPGGHLAKWKTTFQLVALGL